MKTGIIPWADPNTRSPGRTIAAARRWIVNARERDEISNVDGYMDFRQAATPELLQAWCDEYLPEEALKKMKNALLAARKRSRDYKNKRVKYGVDLDHLAHLRLSSLAEELGKTLSETILILEEAYLESQGCGAAG